MGSWRTDTHWFQVCLPSTDLNSNSLTLPSIGGTDNHLLLVDLKPQVLDDKPIQSYFTLNIPSTGYWWRPCWGTTRGLQHNCEQEYRPWWHQTSCTRWSSNWHPCAHYPRFKGEKPHCTLYLGCKRWLIALFLRYRKRISLSWPISFIEAYSWPWSTMLRVWFSVVLGLL